MVKETKNGITIEKYENGATVKYQEQPKNLTKNDELQPKIPALEFFDLFTPEEKNLILDVLEPERVKELGLNWFLIFKKEIMIIS